MLTITPARLVIRWPTPLVLFLRKAKVRSPKRAHITIPRLSGILDAALLDHDVQEDGNLYVHKGVRFPRIIIGSSLGRFTSPPTWRSTRRKEGLACEGQPDEPAPDRGEVLSG